MPKRIYKQIRKNLQGQFRLWFSYWRKIKKIYRKKKKYAGAIVSVFANDRTKNICVLLLVGMLLSLYILPESSTGSFFLDVKASSGNIWQAADLKIEPISTPDFSPSLTLTNTANRSLQVKNIGSLPFQQELTTDNLSGSLCSQLNLTISNSTSTIFSGDIVNVDEMVTGLDLNESLILTTTAALKTGATVTSGDTCLFDFVFTAWQKNMPTATSGGYHDTAIIHNTITTSVSSGSAATSSPDVIINEVMWMGSFNDSGTKDGNDEWIELYNTTASPIDIKNWDIDGAVTGGGGHLEISSGTIPAYGYFLIANKNEGDSAVNVTVDLRATSISFANDYNTNGQLVLKDKNGNIIDATPTPTSSNWPAGIEDDSPKQRWSMERNIVPGDGALSGSWHTCDRDSMNSADLITMLSYWDADAQDYNCGTPGRVNLSANDPTSQDFNSALFGSSSPRILVGANVNLPLTNASTTGISTDIATSSSSSTESSKIPDETSTSTASTSTVPQSATLDNASSTSEVNEPVKKAEQFTEAFNTVNGKGGDNDSDVSSSTTATSTPPTSILSSADSATSTDEITNQS